MTLEEAYSLLTDTQLLKRLSVHQVEAMELLIDHALLPEKLTALREKFDWSVERLADVIGVSHVTVYCWESGERTPHMRSLRAIAAAFDIEAQELLGLSRSHILKLLREIKVLLEEKRLLQEEVRRLSAIREKFRRMKAILLSPEPEGSDVAHIGLEDLDTELPPPVPPGTGDEDDAAAASHQLLGPID